MYAIFNIIYGVPLSKNYDSGDSQRTPEMIQDLIENEERADEGFMGFYSGDSEPPQAFGIKFSEFDECFMYMNLNELNALMVMPPDIIKRYQDLWDEQTPEVQQAITDLGGQPRVFIMHSTS